MSRVHSRFKTPYVSTLLVGAISIVVGIAFMHYLALLTSIVTIGALTAFIVLNVSTLYYFVFKKRAANIFLHIVCPLLGLAVVGYIWSGFEYYTLLIGLGWTIIGVALYAIAQRRGRSVNMEI